jgi:hypothetical protein
MQLYSYFSILVFYQSCNPTFQRRPICIHMGFQPSVLHLHSYKNHMLFQFICLVIPVFQKDPKRCCIIKKFVGNAMQTTQKLLCNYKLAQLKE